MSDEDDPGERAAEGSGAPSDDDDEELEIPEARDMAAELRERTGIGADEGDDDPRTRDMEAELRERTGTDADADDPAPTEVDSETATAFWAAVVFVNAGILLIALGPTVYAIRGRPLVSVALVAAGVYALYRAYSVYRAFDADGGEDEHAADPESGMGSDEG